MTTDEVFARIKALAAAQEFQVQGDSMFAAGARNMDAVLMNAAIANAHGCTDLGSFWVIETVDPYGDEMRVALRIEPPTIISIGPAR